MTLMHQESLIFFYHKISLALYIGIILITIHQNTGTAGMRLLDEKEQEHIWQSVLRLNKDKIKNPAQFTISRENLGTIDGDSEAYYAVRGYLEVIGSYMVI